MNFLFLEDSKDDVELIVHELIFSGFDFDYSIVDNKIDFKRKMLKSDVLFIDCSVPSFTCEDALLVWHNAGEKQPFIIISGTITSSKGIILENIGATAVVLKNELYRIGLVLRKILSGVEK